jgi:hypothetical protein
MRNSIGNKIILDLFSVLYFWFNLFSAVEFDINAYAFVIQEKASRRARLFYGY